MPHKVLVVEDEPLVRMLAVDVVEEAGFEAIEASGADEALALLGRMPDIRLLFTDIDMPGSMDGLRLAAAVRDRWPPIQIIVVSESNVPLPPNCPMGSFPRNRTMSPWSPRPCKGCLPRD